MFGGAGGQDISKHALQRILAPSIRLQAGDGALKPYSQWSPEAQFCLTLSLNPLIAGWRFLKLML